MQRNFTRMTAATLSVAAWIISIPWLPHASASQKQKAPPELPPAVARTVAENRPGARIDKLEVENEQGVKLYDIEFKADRGEIEIAEDGTVIDIATIVK